MFGLTPLRVQTEQEFIDNLPATSFLILPAPDEDAGAPSRDPVPGNLFKFGLIKVC